MFYKQYQRFFGHHCYLKITCKAPNRIYIVIWHGLITFDSINSKQKVRAPAQKALYVEDIYMAILSIANKIIFFQLSLPPFASVKMIYTFNRFSNSPVKSSRLMIPFLSVAFSILRLLSSEFNSPICFSSFAPWSGNLEMVTCKQKSRTEKRRSD